MEDKLKNDIEAIVASIFSEKEEVEIRKKTEEALQKAAVTIEDLTNSLEEKNAEAENHESKVFEYETKVEDLESKLEAANEEIETVKRQLEETENTLKEMEKDKATDVRMAELDEAGVAFHGEKEKANQVVKVREMSDDEFAAYRDELASVRRAVLAELEAASTGGDEAGGDDAGGDDAGGDEAGGDEEEEDTIIPANIDPDKAVSAALNLDIYPSEELSKKYAELGRAMAEKMKK
jgi:predicted RNase H-like nuclease (RuvC/YqgF family)